ncbi:stage III sporulation protein AE [Romboutsia ilealis]|uniref:Stage III sporulation protein AE n=1 Tax=Romboutsia faecis TaxID=2764597 RepID=A0ABR7JMB8_9FIRM|nr:stage III sporulation protein AE [Romboutsia faecis]MBC5996045.1 stage III sporulation protein AE [Romboutsia faecis]MRN23245.1 stage III sporulation protein AE [Romboutsia ilealis]
MKKFLGVLIILLTILNLSTIVLAENESTESYDETKNSIDLYIDSQLSKINIEEMEKYIRDDVAVKSVGLKDFVKNLISGKSNILDLFDKEKIQSAVFSELKTSLRVVAIILVLALLSSILKSLENSFSSGDISKITTYIIFITMVSLTLIGFKDVLNICYNTIDNTIGLMQVVMPILITLLVLIGFPITSTALNPIFLGGVTLINIVFKKFMFLSITIAFAILIINNLSQSIKLKKLSSFIKNINIVTIGAIFTIYLGLVSIQGMYVTSFDKFSVKTAKFAIGNFIPVVGGFVSDSMDILLSSSQLIKNVFGGIGLVLLIGICLIPIIKVLSVVIVYKVAAIVVEPVGEEGMSSFLNDVANLMVIMLACVIAIMIMFFVTIAILTSISVVTH